MQKTSQQKLFGFYERNGGFVDLDGDFQTARYSGHRYAAGVVAQNDQEMHDLGEILRALKIECAPVIYPDGKQVQRISSKESVRLFKKVLEEVTNAYVFEVPEKFAVADCEAHLDFKTASSAGFHLGKIGDFPATEKRVAATNVFCIFGWLELHFAASEHVRFRVRVGLLERANQIVLDDWCRADESKLREIVRDVFRACGIFSDETYIARFCAESHTQGLWQDSNRFGCSSTLD